MQVPLQARQRRASATRVDLLTWHAATAATATASLVRSGVRRDSARAARALKVHHPDGLVPVSAPVTRRGHRVLSDQV